MSVELLEIGKLISELGDDQSVDEAIVAVERRLKLLRQLRTMLETKAEPKPRKSRQKAEA